MRDTNPCKSVGRNYEAKRKRYLTGDELGRLTAALAAHPNQQAANIIRVLLLTGARVGEVQSMRWSGISDGVWTKLASTTKQKQDHTVPLSAPVQQLLSDIRTGQTADREWVFPSSESSTGHVVEIAGAWRAICRSAGIGLWRRSWMRKPSFASQLASGGASLPLIGSLLGHANPATTARYAHLFQDPQRAAVERVGAVVVAAGKGAEATVEAFPKGGRHGR
jgi:integrase